MGGAALSGRAVATMVEDYLVGKALPKGLLPSDEAWAPMAATTRMVDIGAFTHGDGLPFKSTHTDLVPSTLDGYARKVTPGGGKSPPKVSAASPRCNDERVYTGSSARGRSVKAG